MEGTGSSSKGQRGQLDDRAAGMPGAGIGADLAAGARAQLHRSARVKVAPDCSLRGHREVYVVGDPMALGDLPGVAKVAIQSGFTLRAPFCVAWRASPHGPSRYRDLGTLDVVSRFSEARVGFVEVGDFVGWLLWLVVHLAFLTGFNNRTGALARWAISFVGRGGYEGALTGAWAAETVGDLGPRLADRSSVSKPKSTIPHWPQTCSDGRPECPDSETRVLPGCHEHGQR
jgi:NADH dehydrogenase